MASKKKTRAKGRRKRQPRIQAGAVPVVGETNLQEMIAGIRDALDANRPKRAWGLARQVAKKMPPDDEGHLPLVTEALSARISEMLRAGHRDEAVGMASDLLELHPDWRSHFEPGFWLELECAGSEPLRLRQYSELEETAQEIDAWIRTELSDPTCLADLTSLASDHPLRLQSGLIRDAWAEIEAGEGSEAYSALRGIPRRSPFSPWRLFLQALKGYYGSDDGMASTALGHIPAGTVAARAGEMLGLLIDGVPEDDPRIAGLSVKSPVSDLLPHWCSVVKAINADDYHACRSRLSLFGKAAMSAGYRSLALDGLACALEHFDRLDMHFLPDDMRWARAGYFLSFARMAGVCCSRFSAIDAWEFVLERPMLELPPLEKALVLSRVAELMSQELGGEEDELEWPIDEWDDPEDIEQVDECFGKSITCFPLAETYSRWHSFMVRTERDGMQLLQRWRAAFPDDPEPLFLMCSHARGGGGGGGADDAVEALDRLLDLEGRSPRVRALEPFFLLERAMWAFMTGDADAGERLMGRVKAGSPIVEVARQCVRSLAASHRKDRTEKVSTGRVLADLERPFLVWHCFRMLQPGLQKGQLPVGVRRQLSDQELVISSFVDLLAIGDGQWRLIRLGNWGKELGAAVNSYEGPMARLLDLLAGLRVYDPGCREDAVRDVVFTCTRRGLERQDEVLPVFLAYRAGVYMCYAETLSRWHGDVRSGLTEAAAECWQLVDFYAPGDGAYADLIAQLANTDRRGSLCEDRKPLTKKRARKILRIEAACPDLEEAWMRAASRFGGRIPIFPGGSGVDEFYGDGDLDDFGPFAGIDAGEIREALANMGRMFGLNEEEIASGVDAAVSGLGSDGKNGNRSGPRTRGARQKQSPEQGKLGGWPEQLDFPEFDI